MQPVFTVHLWREKDRAAGYKDYWLLSGLLSGIDSALRWTSNTWFQPADVLSLQQNMSLVLGIL